MPSLSVSPAVLTWTPQEVSFTPERVSFGGAMLRWTAQEATFVAGNTSLSVEVPVLDRLTDYDRPNGFTQRDWARQVKIWQAAMTKIEEAFEALVTQVSDNTSILAQIQANQILAQAANDNANEVAASNSLADSYLDPIRVLTASSDGVVTIAAHTRVYGNGDSVSVNGGTVTGFASSDYVTVYYKDAGREGGAVTYQGTTSAVAQSGAVHVVGQVTIPEAGAGTSTGTSPTGSGYTPPGDGSTFEPNYVDP